MRISKVNLLWFSATFTTEKIIRNIARHIDLGPVSEYTITADKSDDVFQMEPDELLIVGVPVYGGRVPALAMDALRMVKGRGTPAVIVCVYGNRDYDDALLELKGITEMNGFKVIAAGAFIGQHSIFPELGKKRPDDKDEAVIRKFAEQIRELIITTNNPKYIPNIKVKGNKPYKTPGQIPLTPKGSSRCNKCGRCVKACPVGAIPADKPRKTDKEKCISCGRCIVLCPRKTRKYRGLIYSFAYRKFRKAYSERKEPEIIIPQTADTDNA